MVLIHHEWDLSGFSGVESNYWEVETLVSAEEGERTKTLPAKGVGETRTIDAIIEETLVVEDPLALFL